MIGLSEPVASVQFPHSAASGVPNGLVRRKYPASSGSLAHNALLMPEVRGERADDCCCCCRDVLMAGLFILCREGSAALRANWGPTLPC